MTSPFALLIVAIVMEVIATSALKTSDGFTRLAPSLIAILCYAVALYLLSIVMRGMSTGVAYAIWSGLGIVLISAVGWFRFGQTLDTPAIIGLGLIIAGVCVVNLFSSAAGH